MLAHALATIRPLPSWPDRAPCPLRSFSRRRESPFFLARLPLAPPLDWRAHKRSAELSFFLNVAGSTGNSTQPYQNGEAPLSTKMGSVTVRTRGDRQECCTRVDPPGSARLLIPSSCSTEPRRFGRVVHVWELLPAIGPKSMTISQKLS